MERAPRPQFEKDDNKEVSQAWEAGLKRRGIEPPAERELAKQEEKGDLKSRYDIATERVARIPERPIETDEHGQMLEQDAEIEVPSAEPGLLIEKPSTRIEQGRFSIKDRLDVLRGKGMGRLAQVAALSALALLSSGVKPPETRGAPAGGQGISAPKDAIPMRESGKETESRATKWPGWVGRMFEVDKKGEIHFNPWVILAPVQFVWKGEMKHANEKTFAPPYEYARQFEADAAAKRPLRPEDHKKITNYVGQQLNRRFVDTIGTLGEGVDRFNYGAPKENQGEITSIQITGFASPEGPRSKGPSTLAPGKVDQENLRLAKARAEAALGYTKADLAKVSEATGINIAVLEKTLQNVKAEEVQFSDAELKELAKLAAGHKGADDLEKIFNLVADYNDDSEQKDPSKKKIKDAKTVSRLHDIVGSKRKAEIQVTYDGKNVERHSIPIPWLPLLLLVPLMRRRRGEPTPEPPVTPESGEPDLHDRYPFLGKRPVEKESEETKIAPEEEKTLPPSAQNIERARLLEQIHKDVTSTRLPERGTKEFEEMEEATYTDDLYQFFDDPESIRLGIDYRAMADDLDQKWDIFKTSDERENYLANEILNAWKKKDRLCRVEAGVSEDSLDNGLDYENQPRQIQWAKMHARSLLRVIDKRKEFSESERKRIDYLDLLSPQVKKMIQRRGRR
ncbi:MAG: hypothetical protein HYW90_01980 [Candidatus Sungbacteria bacterium]|nr:hypothetical protein [Candidatus Sungbacteria bacterium]